MCKTSYMTGLRGGREESEAVISDLRRELDEEKEKFRIAAIHISEYVAWVGKAESENKKLREALENLFMRGLVIGETSQYFIDAKAALERE